MSPKGNAAFLFGGKLVPALLTSKTLTIYTISGVKLTRDTRNENTLPHKPSCLPRTRQPRQDGLQLFRVTALGGVTPMWTHRVVNSESQHDLNAVFRENKLLGNINKDIYYK